MSYFKAKKVGKNLNFPSNILPILIQIISEEIK